MGSCSRTGYEVWIKRWDHVCGISRWILSGFTMHMLATISPNSCSPSATWAKRSLRSVQVVLLTISDSRVGIVLRSVDQWSFMFPGPNKLLMFLHQIPSDPKHTSPNSGILRYSFISFHLAFDGPRWSWAEFPCHGSSRPRRRQQPFQLVKFVVKLSLIFDKVRKLCLLWQLSLCRCRFWSHSHRTDVGDTIRLASRWQHFLVESVLSGVFCAKTVEGLMRLAFIATWSLSCQP